MPSEHVHDALREMAADTNGTTQKQVVFMTAAVVADIAEQVNDLGEHNKSLDKEVEKNTDAIARYNRGLWLLGGGAGIWGLERLFTAIFGG